MGIEERKEMAMKQIMRGLALNHGMPEGMEF